MERTKDRIADHMVDIPVPLVMEEIVAVVQEVVRLVSQECVQQRIDEEPVEVPVPQVWDEIAEVVRLVPQERVQRIDEQIVEVYFTNYGGHCRFRTGFVNRS